MPGLDKNVIMLSHFNKDFKDSQGKTWIPQASTSISSSGKFNGSLQLSSGWLECADLTGINCFRK